MTRLVILTCVLHCFLRGHDFLTSHDECVMLKSDGGNLASHLIIAGDDEGGLVKVELEVFGGPNCMFRTLIVGGGGYSHWEAGSGSGYPGLFKINVQDTDKPYPMTLMVGNGGMDDRTFVARNSTGLPTISIRLLAFYLCKNSPICLEAMSLFFLSANCFTQS